MWNEQPGNELADETSRMTQSASDADSELRKRRSTRIVQAVPLNVSGVDALGRPFSERTSTLIINCHGCRYQSKHYVLKNMWVNLEVPNPEAGRPPRRVRGKVAWIQRPRTVRQLFQVALELETPGNAWGIAFPPEDWFVFPEEVDVPPIGGIPSELPPAYGSANLDVQPLAGEHEPSTHDNLRIFPVAGNANDPTAQLARHVTRLLSEAKQQIQLAAREAASQAIASESRIAAEQSEQRYAAFREELSREAAQALENIQQETAIRSRTIHATASENIKEELPRWLAPQLEQLTHELTAQVAREGALQREQQEKQLAAAQEALQALCTQAEDAAEQLRISAEQAEARVQATIDMALQRASDAAQLRDQAMGTHHEALAANLNQIQERVNSRVAETESALREQLAREIEGTKQNWQSAIETAVQAAEEQSAQRLADKTQRHRDELREETEKQTSSFRELVETQSHRLEEMLHRADEVTERLEQYASRIETVQQQAIAGFQSQLDDVLSLHRNELHRQSDGLFEEVHNRIRNSFETANSESLARFEEQVREMVEPHVRQTEEAIHRLAGGRSLLDAAMTMQQDRIRNSADEAFAESLGRFRENLGTVEQVLNESAQTITTRHLEELEAKSVDLKHHTMEEMFKSAEWYEKKAQSQVQSLTEKLANQTDKQLRDKAAEISSLFASELHHASEGYLNQFQSQSEETVRSAFDRIRGLSAEAADTTTAAFTDEIQRNARTELEGFNELLKQSLESSKEKMNATQAEVVHKVTAAQEEFLLRFRGSIGEVLDQELSAAHARVQENFAQLQDTWRKSVQISESEIRSTFGRASDEGAEQYRNRLENISNSWMVATVATLDHQSRDVIAKIAANAEERLKEASAEVFSRFGETLKNRLEQIARGFETESRNS